jgi:tetraacyldisaccharide 4'-kinase
MRTPRWWYRRDGKPSALMAPLLSAASRLWAWRMAARIAAGPRARVGAPVISVGNLTLGGSGKTPVARAIRAELEARGLDAAILTRGHGGRLAGPVRVDAQSHDAADVGDEALMLARDGAVWVARDRIAGARAAVEAGVAALVLDDAHQNAALAPDLAIVVVDGETRNGEWPFGAGGVFPAGPLREPLAQGLARADLVILLLPEDAPAPDPALVRMLDTKPILIARRRLAPPPPGRWLGFAGIAKPWRFEQALRAAGCDLADFAAFADHAPIRNFTALQARAEALGARLAATEKDWMRLEPDQRALVWRCDETVEFEDPAALARALDSLLS